MAPSRYTDAEHDAFVKAADEKNRSGSRIKVSEPGSRRRMQSSSRQSPGWAQVLTNDLGRIQRDVRYLTERFERLQRLLEQFLTPSVVADLSKLERDE